MRVRVCCCVPCACVCRLCVRCKEKTKLRCRGGTMQCLAISIPGTPLLSNANLVGLTWWDVGICEKGTNVWHMAAE